MISSLDHIDLKADKLQLLSSEQAWHYKILPHENSNGQLQFYIDADQATDHVTMELEMIFGQDVVLEPVDSVAIQKALSKYYRKSRTTSKKLEFKDNSSDFLRDLIAEAKEIDSSDIHIEVYDEKARVRLRIDGVLVERYVLNEADYPALINKVKILSNLDIAEKRLPQDGRIFFETPNDKFDIRVSILPTLHGEKVVMRILSNDATNIDITALGLENLELDNYLEGIKRPNGMMLISGPTGSGKTTTLYATLKILNEDTRNVVTIEDPIEYTLDGINQVQLKESIGLTFGSALRTFLRQDPDVIMVGEIRDPDTANMAIRAALTGHLVLSTIHTNSAWGTVSRLIDMGVPPFLLASTLNCTVAQRLVRKLCDHCKLPSSEFDNVYPKSFKPFRKLKEHYLPLGCDMCYHTGYKGRIAVYEVIPIDSELADKIKEVEMDIDNELKERKIKMLAENAFDQIESGNTSIEEAYPLLMNL